MEKEDVNLCIEIVKTMEILGFKESSIEKLATSPEFVRSFSKPSKMQRIDLILFFNDLFNSLPIEEIAPDNIRDALAVGILPLDWLADMKLGVLPYFKQNEELYFG